MKLALLKGNRFNPWHLQVFGRLRGRPEITAFRAESEIQRHFRGRDDGSLGFGYESIYFDTQRGNPFTRLKNELLYRYGGREPRILPFHERLQKFDLIQSWELHTDWSGEGALARERYGTPLLVMVWDNIPFNMEHNKERRERKKRVAAAADCFLVHTERSRRMLDIEGVSGDRIVQIDPGVDLDVFCPGTRNRGALGLSDDEFVILFVGWLLPRKGIDFLVLAVRELLNDPTLSRRKIRLLVVGSGPGRPRVERLIERVGISDACTFAGSLPYDRMPEVYRAADVFVLPSIATREWQEQFGMALIEAMACGLPVVATLSGAIPEIAGEAALLCQPNDFLSLQGAISKLATDAARRKELGEAARQRAQARFDINVYAKQLSDIYERVPRGS
ncbi:MAG TPA: glycosyltransferase [Candidatus Hydrogenedentes bacterium]|nr:glycosyltransferase [Candidatus Hydrogenedentota bacterium]HIJ74027.1 glycosyltransferase [Candidatus Hydrogenedentota bacterium]